MVLSRLTSVLDYGLWVLVDMKVWNVYTMAGDQGMIHMTVMAKLPLWGYEKLIPCLRSCSNICSEWNILQAFPTGCPSDVLKFQFLKFPASVDEAVSPNSSIHSKVWKADLHYINLFYISSISSISKYNNYVEESSEIAETSFLPSISE